MFDSLNDASEKTNYAGKTFIGRVVDNNDPLRVERVKAEVIGLYEGDPEVLPWIAPKVAKGFGNKAGSGVFSVPDLDSFVYIELQDGNPHYPFYVGSPVQVRVDLPEADVNYPNRYGFKDRRGNTLIIDTTPGQNILTFIHASGTQVRINNDGSVDLTVAGPLVSSAPVWRHDGDIELTGNLAVDGAVTAANDVIAQGVSLRTHIHGGVDTGGGNTTGPVG